MTDDLDIHVHAGPGPEDHFKPSPTCSRQDCGQPTAVRPVLLCYPVDMPEYTGDPAEVHVGITACEAHRASTTVADLLNDEAYATLSAAFVAVGRRAPDRDRMELRWLPVKVLQP